jgi:tRNA splicing endonuclease
MTALVISMETAVEADEPGEPSLPYSPFFFTHIRLYILQHIFAYLTVLEHSVRRVVYYPVQRSSSGVPWSGFKFGCNFEKLISKDCCFLKGARIPRRKG